MTDQQTQIASLSFEPRLDESSLNDGASHRDAVVAATNDLMIVPWYNFEASVRYLRGCGYTDSVAVEAATEAEPNWC